jgi:hypothetical protein
MRHEIELLPAPSQVFALGHRGRPAGMIDVTPGMAYPHMVRVTRKGDTPRDGQAKGSDTPIARASNR